MFVKPFVYLSNPILTRFISFRVCMNYLFSFKNQKDDKRKMIGKNHFRGVIGNRLLVVNPLSHLHSAIAPRAAVFTSRNTSVAASKAPSVYIGLLICAAASSNRNRQRERECVFTSSFFTHAWR